MNVIATEADYTITLLRFVAGIIVFPYGMQKLLGWFEWPGIKFSLIKLKEAKVPLFIGWLIA